MNKKLKSLLGYRKDSPFKDEPYLVIESNNITMDNVDKDLILLPNKGKPVIAKANSGGYLFPNASRVKEIPLYQQGGQIDSNQVKKFDKEKLKAVQLDLKAKGLYKGKIDGSFGPLMEKAIRKYNIRSLIKEDKRIPSRENPYVPVATDSQGSTRTAPVNPQTVEDKQKTLEVFGVLPEQVASKPWFAERINKTISPLSDYTILSGLSKFIGGKDRLSKLKTVEDYDKESFESQSDLDNMLDTEQEDLWSMYLGLPQRYKSVGVSSYVPTKSKDKSGTYYKLQDPNHAKWLTEKAKELKIGESKIFTEDDFETDSTGQVQNSIGSLGTYTLSKGRDDKGEYISYYDKWDLAPSGVNVNVIGKPLEIYDRVYLDKKYQAGGVSMKPVSPFMDLKMFKNRYKLEQLPTYQMGGILDDYIKTLPEEQQNLFMGEFQSLEPDVQQEVLFMLGGKYQMGGTAEVEGDETAVLPDSELVEFKGKKHKDGGIPVNLPNGTRIYSEYSTAPAEIVEQVLGKKTKGKMSYADLSKKFPTSSYMEILSDEKSDEYEKNGAQLKLMNNLSKLDTIFYAQEAEKKSNGDKYQMGGQFGGSGAGVDFDWTSGQPIDINFPMNPSTLMWKATDKNRPFSFSQENTGGESQSDENVYARKYIPLHGEDQSIQTIPQVRGKQSKQRAKPVLDLTGSDSSLLEIPLPFGQLPMTNNQVVSQGIQAPETAPTLNQEGTDSTSYESQDDKDFPLRSKENRFGISSKLAGTIADIGLALSDKLRVSEPTLYDRRKYPLFTRFVDFDDKEVQRMYDKGIQQIQNSNVPEAQKQAQITELLSKYQDYQGKVDYNNLQRYEGKREGDTNKLQQYLDQNVDIKVADTQDYKERKSRTDYLRDQFLAQRKSRVVNSLKAYGEYADKINMANQLYTENYTINPISGRINYKPNQKSDLTQDLLEQYSRNAQNKVNLGNGLVGVKIGNKLIVTNADGTKFEAVNIE